jgi:hypothetical protein
MRILFLFILTVHGAINLLGFFKAYNLAEISQLTQPISRFSGVLWLLAALLLVVACIMLLFHKDSWWVVAATGIILSQVLIFRYWSDAKFGTIANLIILFPVLIALRGSLPGSYKNQFESEARKRLVLPDSIASVTEADLDHLPLPLQTYLHLVGVVGKPQVHNFRVAFEGEMRAKKDAGWNSVKVRQYSFIDDPARLFYIEMKMFGLPLDGLHQYTGSTATMRIRLLSIFQIVHAKGKEMNQGETVTMFNDMCLLAPASLISKQIRWDTVDSLTVIGTFTNQGNTISAKLLFNEKGELVNFISTDRFQSIDGKIYNNYPWSTPIKNYSVLNGYNLPADASAIWKTPEGDLSYAHFVMKEIEYNCREFK